MGLPTVVNLVLNEMHQQPIAPFNLDPDISIDPHFAAQRSGRQGVADPDEALVHRRLGSRKLSKGRKRHFIFPGLRSQPTALQRINVKKINDVNMVQRPLQAREEARALGFKFGWAQFGARPQ